eukprot:878153-Pleurochrysis_carterae.AAC.1
MRADSWRSPEEFARFETLWACRAGGPDATLTLRRDVSVPHHTSSVQSAPHSGPVPPRAENA